MECSEEHGEFELVNHKNPSMLFLWIPGVQDAIRIMNDLSEVIGQYGSIDEEKSLYVRNIEEATRIEYDNSSLEEVLRGRLRFERKKTIDDDPPYEIVIPFKPYYYFIRAGARPLLIIVGDKGIQTYIHRLLTSLGLHTEPVNLGRRPQERLMQRRDIKNYAIQTQDDADPRIKKVRAVAPSGLVDIRGSIPEQFVDGRGHLRDQGLSWESHASRPQITFWIAYSGSIYVRHPQVNEQHLLELIELIVSVL